MSENQTEIEFCTERCEAVAFMRKVMKQGYGICDACDDVVDGASHGWHNHTEHGEGNVCEHCADMWDEHLDDD